MNFPLKEKHQSWISFIIELIVLISLVLFVRFYVFQFFRVHGGSMCPTLNQIDDQCLRDKGEFIFVNEFLYNFIRDPKRGEVVVFKPPTGDKPYIKRVIGVPGDIIEIIGKRVYITNDKYEQELLDESYLSARNDGNTRASQTRFVVPTDHVLLFGDNRNGSLDARDCFTQSSLKCNSGISPYIHKDNVVGKASTVIWPVWRARSVENKLEYLENEIKE